MSKDGTEDEKAQAAGAVGSTGAADKTEADRRRERAAQKLRENLARRKQQVRARRAGQADETDGLPAAKMDES
ncbi:hypothetical protein DTW90_06025 [Neorhizobium sp. P12A]|uniref:hypothetical protein n=1 Tax=Rhizobium/Agrobacterium group TaxID=227290 RepID=UPI00104DBD2D|nr:MULTISPECIES: hypothetical protein [Rhizobium/Agrobacterium group]KAA0701324.1 hypothetical protein DTW90_06025 [Neorhizobium sp. P12A]TCR81536.1 hypothetical protein EV561_112109 [Rhizobium sp. BK376]